VETSGHCQTTEEQAGGVWVPVLDGYLSNTPRRFFVDEDRRRDHRVKGGCLKISFPPVSSPEREGGGDYSQKIQVEVCGPLHKTLILCKTKICDFSLSFSWPERKFDTPFTLFQTCLIISSLTQSDLKAL